MAIGSQKEIGEKERLELYRGVPGSFYDDLLKSRNPLRRWFHSNRYQRMQSLVRERYAAGDRILDIGAGSGSWNQGRLNVCGMDLNEALLRYGKETGRLADYRVGDIRHLDFPDEDFSLVVGSEILEHLDSAETVVREVWRVLKPGGFFIVSVPDDSGFSAWRVLFPVLIFYEGILRGDIYFKKRCGHVQNFSPARLRSLLGKGGFTVETLFSFWGLSLYAVARKPPRPQESVS